MAMATFERVLKKLEEEKKSPRTVDVYRAIYMQYAKFLGGRKPTVENAEEWLGTKSHLAAASISLRRMAFRTLFNGLGVEIPKGRLKSLRVNNVREDKFVTRAQVDQLHRVADLRDKVVIRMLYHAGLRAQELVDLNVEDLDLKNHRVYVNGLKGSHKVRSVRFIRPELVIPTIRAYLQKRGIDLGNPGDRGKEPLVLGKNGQGRITYEPMREAVKRLGGAIGKPDLSPHWLRHGFVVWNKVHGVPPEITARQIGDTVQTTTMVYSHYSQSDVDRVYDEIQGRVPEEDKAVKNPIEEIDELREMNRGLEKRLEEQDERLKDQEGKLGKVMESLEAYTKLQEADLDRVKDFHPTGPVPDPRPGRWREGEERSTARG